MLGPVQMGAVPPRGASPDTTPGSCSASSPPTSVQSPHWPSASRTRTWTTVSVTAGSGAHVTSISENGRVSVSRTLRTGGRVDDAGDRLGGALLHVGDRGRCEDRPHGDLVDRRGDRFELGRRIGVDREDERGYGARGFFRRAWTSIRGDRWIGSAPTSSEGSVLPWACGTDGLQGSHQTVTLSATHRVGRRQPGVSRPTPGCGKSYPAGRTQRDGLVTALKAVRAAGPGQDAAFR